MPKPAFKPCNQRQPMLLPPDLSDLIPEGHMVRVVDAVVEPIDVSELYALYPGGGASAYDPKMMLKIVIYAYASGIYSSRKIERLKSCPKDKELKRASKAFEGDYLPRMRRYEAISRKNTAKQAMARA